MTTFPFPICSVKTVNKVLQVRWHVAVSMATANRRYWQTECGKDLLDGDERNSGYHIPNVYLVTKVNPEDYAEPKKLPASPVLNKLQHIICPKCAGFGKVFLDYRARITLANDMRLANGEAWLAEQRANMYWSQCWRKVEDMVVEELADSFEDLLLDMTVRELLEMIDASGGYNVTAPVFIKAKMMSDAKMAKGGQQ